MSKHDCCKEKSHRHCSVWKCVGWGVLGVIGFAAIAALLGLAIMLLWNWLIPGIFSLPAIGYCQAIGLAVLSRLLFGGCGGGFRHFHRKHRGRWHKHGCGCGCGCGCNDESDKDCCSDKQQDGDECCKKEDQHKE